MRASSLRLLATATLGLALSACTMWPEKKEPGWKDATGVEQHERLYWQAIKDHDWKNIESRTASNFTHVAAAGVMDKSQALGELKKVSDFDFSLGDFAVTAHGDSAVVTYTANFKMTYDGKPSGPVTLRRMDVWQLQKAGWVLVATADMSH